ncbi:N-substituted formamide deformylase [Sinobacterium norvegicum]|uniref:N-substituted formamide deformylase n=1 Tax=Sinobacterium norvegicum TaxID=1641715 RepID=A0ABM9AG07_9GAMM|nr:amidohydrolase [Sinobacterium norvegicum]CAH0991925.1 N-substituted formamide deformylase [Sinobacterium norvegicum]
MKERLKMQEMEQFPAAAIPYSNDVIIVTANIITVNPQQPRVEAMAYCSGRILALGSLTEVTAQLAGRDYSVDNRFIGKTIVPGFIEAHMHPILASVLTSKFHYAGPFDRVGNGGKILQGSPTLATLTARLTGVRDQHNAAGKKGQWINIWGLEPLLIGAEAMINRDFIDAIIDDSPVCILHSSCHLLSMNSLALAKTGFCSDGNADVVFRQQQRLTGVAAELANIYQVIEAGGLDYGKSSQEIALCLIDYSQVLHRFGVTTAADCGMGMPFDPYPLYQVLAKNRAFKLRLAAYPLAEYFTVDDVEAMAANNHDRLAVNKIKFARTDGSIQVATACLLDEHYYNGRPNKAMVNSGEQIFQQCIVFHRAGYNLSFHCNGSGATEQLLDVIARMQRHYPRSGARHCLEHNQMVTPEQLVRMKQLGVVHNLCANQLAVWGDFHASTSLGPERVATLNPFQSSVEHGVRFAIHSDDVATQAQPLLMMSNAMSRQSNISGNVYGKNQCLTASQALHAVTLGPAFLLGQEHCKGSIEIGKLADFVVLEQNPLVVDEQRVKDIVVYATSLGGEISVHR